MCVGHNSVCDSHTAEPAVRGSTAVSTDAQQFPHLNIAAVRELYACRRFDSVFLSATNVSA